MVLIILCELFKCVVVYDIKSCLLDVDFGDKYGKKLMNTAIKAGTNFNSKYGKKLADTAIKIGKDYATIAGKKIVHKSAETTGEFSW